MQPLGCWACPPVQHDISLELCLELLEDGQTLVQPCQELRLHGVARHALEALNLLLHIGHSSSTSELVLPGLDEVLLLVAATSLSLHRAERRTSVLLDVLLQVWLTWAQLGTHGIAGLLLVLAALVSGLLIEVTDSRPPPGTRAALTHLVLGEIDIAEDDIIVPGEFLDDCIPLRGLLDSSASPLTGDPPHEYGLASINPLFDEGVCVLGRELSRVVPMVVRVDARRSDRDERGCEQ